MIEGRKERKLSYLIVEKENVSKNSLGFYFFLSHHTNFHEQLTVILGVTGRLLKQ